MCSTARTDIYRDALLTLKTGLENDKRAQHQPTTRHVSFGGEVLVEAGIKPISIPLL